MATPQDDFTVARNATFERLYQIVFSGVPRNIAGWRLHGQWRFADGELALDLTLENGLIQVVDASLGKWKMFIEPADLASIGTAALAYDVLAVPPAGRGLPHIYRAVAGAIQVSDGSTLDLVA